jgi:predicted MPP superfamily phosphohydrolase
MLVWLSLTIIGTWVHLSTWTAPAGPISGQAAGPGSTAGEWSLKLAGNMLIVPSSPGWLLMTRLNQGLDPHSVRFALLANAIGYAPWCLAAWGLYALLAHRRPRPLPHAHPAAPHTPPTSAGAGLPDPSRRRLLTRSLLLGGVGLPTCSLAYGSLIEPWRLRRTSYRVPIANLPPELDGVRFAVMGDTHFGPRVPASHVRDAVEMAVDLRPDAYLLVGDYVHYGPQHRGPAYELLRPILDTHKAVAVLGNHDNYYGQHAIARDELVAAGAVYVENSRVFMMADRALQRDVPPAGTPALCIAGIPDWWTERDKIRLDEALGGVPPTMPRLLLSHAPDAAELPPIAGRTDPRLRSRVDLMLSGHTHGGQVRLPLLGTPVVPSDYGSRYAYGLCRGPGCPVLVTSGVGVSILPIRIGVPPEVVELTLVRLEEAR